MSGRHIWPRSEVFGVDTESISRESKLLLLPSPKPLLCPVSSCASNFNSTSVFINLLLTSQGDRIQTLTQISAPDWLDTATPRGHTTKKEAHIFPPPFISACFLYLLLLPSMSCVLPFFLNPQLLLLHLYPLSSSCPSSTSSCVSLCVPPCQSAVWVTFHLLLHCDGQTPTGSDRVICL